MNARLRCFGRTKCRKVSTMVIDWKPTQHLNQSRTFRISLQGNLSKNSTQIEDQPEVLAQHGGEISVKVSVGVRHVGYAAVHETLHRALVESEV